MAGDETGAGHGNIAEPRHAIVRCSNQLAERWRAGLQRIDLKHEAEHCDNDQKEHPQAECHNVTPNAAAVSGPTSPSSTKPRETWNAATACAVRGPYSPSIAPGS